MYFLVDVLDVVNVYTVHAHAKFLYLLDVQQVSRRDTAAPTTVSRESHSVWIFLHTNHRLSTINGVVAFGV